MKVKSRMLGESIRDLIQVELPLGSKFWAKFWKMNKNEFKRGEVWGTEKDRRVLQIEETTYMKAQKQVL